MKSDVSLSDELNRRLSKREVVEWSRVVDGDKALRDGLFGVVAEAGSRQAMNALWIFATLSAGRPVWLAAKRNTLADVAISTANDSVRRLALVILNNIGFGQDDVRTDFIDFCLLHITSEITPCATRALCVKLAYCQCRFYPELLRELHLVLEMLATQPLSPAMRSVLRHYMPKTAGWVASE